MKTLHEMSDLHNAALQNLLSVGPEKIDLGDLAKIKRLGYLQTAIKTAKKEGPKNGDDALSYILEIQSNIIEAQTIIVELILRGDLAVFLEFNLEAISLATEWVNSFLHEMPANGATQSSIDLH